MGCHSRYLGKLIALQYSYKRLFLAETLAIGTQQCNNAMLCSVKQLIQLDYDTILVLLYMDANIVYPSRKGTS